MIFRAILDNVSECSQSREHEIKFLMSYFIDFSLLILGTDPFASVFGNESFGDGFADFSTLSKVTCID